MSTVARPPARPAEARDYPPGHEPVHHYLREPGPGPEVRGLRRAWAVFLSWATTVDHKRIGVMYLTAVSISFLIGGIAALGVRYELLTPERELMGPDAYNHLFTF